MDDYFQMPDEGDEWSDHAVSKDRSDATADANFDAENAIAPTDEQILAGMDKTLASSKKRTVRAQPKLDENRLCNKTGLRSLPDEFAKWKPNPNRDEYENLKEMMGKIEYWAHRVFPKLKFDDFLNRVELLGEKKRVKNCMQKIRLNISDEDDDNTNDNNLINDMDGLAGNSKILSHDMEVEEINQHIDDKYLEDPFDQFYETAPSRDLTKNQSQTSSPANIGDESSDILSSVDTQKSQPKQEPMLITDAQRERMEQNRRRAMEIRQKRLQFFERQKQKVEENETQSITDMYDCADEDHL